jgi:hypothetical protein
MRGLRRTTASRPHVDRGAEHEFGGSGDRRSRQPRSGGIEGEQRWRCEVAGTAACGEG